jgi:hypothetical protein
MPLTVGQYEPQVQPGTYQATITGVIEDTSKKDGSRFRRWDFTLDDGRTVTATSSLAFSAKSKAGEWLTNILGRQLVKDEEIEPVGLRCTISVVLNEEGYERIAGVFAATSPKPAPVRSAPVAASGGAVSVPPADGTEAATEDLPF